MSLRVEDFKVKSGTCEIEQDGNRFTLDLYDFYGSNCFLTAIYHYKDKENGNDNYQLQWFFCDEPHAKRMLGLVKNFNGEKENVFADEIKKITVYKKTSQDWKKWMRMFAEAFDHLTIEIREEE